MSVTVFCCCVQLSEGIFWPLVLGNTNVRKWFSASEVLDVIKWFSASEVFCHMN
jgi:hypothetical protein